jgi:hypothetical protein
MMTCMKIIKIEIESTRITVVRMLLFFLHKVADHGIRAYVENLEMMIDHKWTLAKARRTAAKKYTSSFLQRVTMHINYDIFSNPSATFDIMGNFEHMFSTVFNTRMSI